jgi:hypothetical protein
MYGCLVLGFTFGLGGDFLRGEGWRTRRAEDNAGDVTSSSTEIDSGFWDDVSLLNSAHISASRSSPDNDSSRESGWGGGGGSTGSWASFICDREAMSSLFVNLPARMAPTNRWTSPAPALGDRGVRFSSLRLAKSSALLISPDCIALTKLETCWPLAGGGGGASAASSSSAIVYGCMSRRFVLPAAARRLAAIFAQKAVLSQPRPNDGACCRPLPDITSSYPRRCCDSLVRSATSREWANCAACRVLQIN